MRRDKRASLELSIRAIVIVVLAMTLLGLGLTFIRGVFLKTEETSTVVQEQVRQQIINDLITSDKKISFPNTEIKIDKGGSTLLTVGIRNKKDDRLFYKMRFNPISGPDDGPFSIEGPNWFQYGTDTVYELGAADSDVRNIRLSIPTSVNAGSYFLTFEVLDDDLPEGENVYSTQDFFIVVRG